MNPKQLAAASLLVMLVLASCAAAGPPTGRSDASGAADGATTTLPADAAPAEPGASSSSVDPADFSERGLAAFDNTRAMRHVRRLASGIGTRVKASRGERRGARYVAEKLRNYGYNVWIQRFSVDGRTSRNVVARWPGAHRYGIVIGGHVDTVPGSPGANDNASGVAVVIEMARLAAGKAQSRFITFIAFGSEEYGRAGTHHDGSRVHVARLGPEGRRRLAGMISVDMIADGRPLLAGNSAIASDVVARTLYRKIDGANIDVRYHVLCDCTDHGPFEHAGIPASFMYSGQEPDYHSPADTVPNMRPRDMRRTGRALRAFVKDVDPGMIKRFRNNR